VLAGELRAAGGRCLPSSLSRRSFVAPRVARRENSAAALRSLAGFAGASRLIARQENSAAARHEPALPAPPAAG
jgi:hypothetical protein